MKKILAFILTFVILISSAAAEEAFINGAAGLLESINLERDMVTLKAAQEETLQAKIRGGEGITDLALELDGNKVRIQLMEDQIYLAVDDTILNLKYADLQAMMTTGIDMAMVGKLFQEAVECFIQPHAKVELEDGLHMTYAVSGEELTNDLMQFGDRVLEDEGYQLILRQALEAIERISGEKTPAMEELVQTWQAIKENMKSSETDFHAALDLKVDAGLTELACKGEIGSEKELYLMDWVVCRGKERLNLEGKLTQRLIRSESTKDYDITIAADFFKGIWSATIDAPGRAFYLTAEGTHTDRTGRFSIFMQRARSGSPYYMVQGSYAMADDCGSIQVNVKDRRRIPYVVSAVMDRSKIDMNVTYQNGLKPFALKAVLEDNELMYASLEANSRGESYRAVYDDEKVILYTDDLQVIFTGAFESDHTYVVTIHPVFPEGSGLTSEDASARIEYEGEEGNFAFTGRVIDPEGKEVISAQLICEPTEGITEKLADAGNITYLTPETILKMLIQ